MSDFPYSELPYIPEYITVHLGTPESSAQNVTVSFPEYIKNVASSEIYPTWPENAIRANVYAQITYALNRVYTEFYKSKGYDFDITNSTKYDQAFVYGRDIYDNISQIVDELFNDYIVKQQSVEPYFTQYCNGTTVVCDGLSQWGTVDLANQGYTPYEILKYYYGDDIDIIRNVEVEGIRESAPFVPLRLGSSGNDVQTIQVRLNRISRNYPAIPKIYPTDGNFGPETVDAVKEFQKIFNLTQDGIIGKATWYKIQYVYNGVKRLNELTSEGLSLEDVSKQFPNVLKEGDTGLAVQVLQYFLKFISQYEETIYPIEITGIYDQATKNAVLGFQKTYDLVADGIVGDRTWYKMYYVYRGIIDSLPEDILQNIPLPYPGIPQKLGMQNENIRVLQEYLNYISDTYTSIPKLEVSGVYGVKTKEAIEIFQRLFGLTVTGVTGPLTWGQITDVYTDLKNGLERSPEQYPGYKIS